MAETSTEAPRGEIPASLTEPGWVQVVATTWATALCAVNPLLVWEAVYAAVLPWAEELGAVLVREPFDPSPGVEIGERMEALESMQPDDLQRVQKALLPVLVPALTPGQQDRASALLFALGSGFFVAKARRASEFDMNAQSRLSHDLKTPINAITGFSRVILKGIDGPITDFQREDLTSIYEAGQRMLTMINEVFSVRKRDAARTLLYEAPFQVSDLMADVARTVQPLAGERGHTLELRMVGELGAMALDASMVRWVLLSLIGYALRQVDRSLIAVSAARDEDDGNTLLFHVSYRPPTSISAYGGAAAVAAPEAPGWPGEIGLLTCRHFCEELGGHVDLLAGEAMVFQVRLPAVPRRFLD